MVSIVYFVSFKVGGKRDNYHRGNWQKKLVFIYLPEQLNGDLSERDIIGIGHAKSN
jgi:hypothetical protein